LLPISALPPSIPDHPGNDVYPGASARDGLVDHHTARRQFGQISGLASMNSTARLGLRPSRSNSLSIARSTSQRRTPGAINRRRIPPRDLRTAEIQQGQSADTPILTLSITSDSLPLDRVNDFADTLLAQSSAKLAGVGLVTIQGNQKAGGPRPGESRTISALKLSLGRCPRDLGQANVNAPKAASTGRASRSHRIDDQIFSATPTSRSLLLQDGAPIRLGDIATSSTASRTISSPRGRLEKWRASRSPAGHPAQPGANIIQTAIREGIAPAPDRHAAPSVRVSILADRTETIRASVTDVQFTLLLTVVLVVM